MALSWCKVASNLDSHPKVRRAGRNGREVFLFALRRNAEPGNPVPGRLPKDELEPWYIADQLQMPESEAVTGVTAAVTAGLIAQDGESWVIVGFDVDWGKSATPGKDRTAKWRENKKLEKSVTGVTSPNVTQRHGDGCDALEEKRREENTEGPAADAPGSGDSTGLRDLKTKVKRTVADKAALVPIRAWRAADYLRGQILAEDPKAAVGRQPWADDVQSGWRLGWANEIRLMVERDARTYEEIAETMKFVFYEQSPGHKFVVQSPGALRDKWDRIQAVRRNQAEKTSEKSKQVPMRIPLAGSDRR